jgi:hypothetical protein
LNERPWQGVDQVRPALPSSGFEALSLDQGRVPEAKQDWVYQIMAWLPFGLLFLALLDRTNGPAEAARLMGESLSAASPARSAAQPAAGTGPEQRAAVV